jgi:hypothetical protein
MDPATDFLDKVISTEGEYILSLYLECDDLFDIN